MLCAVGYDYLRGLVIEIVVGFKLFCDCPFKRGQARRRNVLCIALVKRAFRRLTDVLGSVEVGFANAEVDNALARGFKLVRLCGNCKRHRGRNGFYSVRNLNHNYFLRTILCSAIIIQSFAPFCNNLKYI